MTEKICPDCKKHAKSDEDITKDFGWRMCAGVKRPQSRCKPCRSAYKPKGLPKVETSKKQTQKFDDLQDEVMALPKPERDKVIRKHKEEVAKELAEEYGLTTNETNNPFHPYHCCESTESMTSPGTRWGTGKTQREAEHNATRAIFREADSLTEEATRLYALARSGLQDGTLVIKQTEQEKPKEKKVSKPKEPKEPQPRFRVEYRDYDDDGKPITLKKFGMNTKPSQAFLKKDAKKFDAHCALVWDSEIPEVLFDHIFSCDEVMVCPADKPGHAISNKPLEYFSIMHKLPRSEASHLVVSHEIDLGHKLRDKNKSPLHDDGLPKNLVCLGCRKKFNRSVFKKESGFNTWDYQYGRVCCSVACYAKAQADGVDWVKDAINLNQKKELVKK